MIHMLLAVSLSLVALPVITLERTTCFGTCPAYKVTIFDDGKVVYEGKDFVKRKGKAESQITKAELEDLVREFDRINYFSLDDEYVGDPKNCPESWTDNPSATTSLNWKDKTKTIRHYHGCRGSSVLDQLTALENKIDEVVNTKRWIE
jgi:Domain of unknown function (DUF6438)